MLVLLCMESSHVVNSRARGSLVSAQDIQGLPERSGLDRPGFQAPRQLLQGEGGTLGAQRGGDVVQRDVEGAHTRSRRRCWAAWVSCRRGPTGNLAEKRKFILSI